uniref:Uncharacterized protein n=1 Tax=Globisporangium ultimum (strain ATCC 200006 / CBS 805.95 / DAOM BR144) TaxID=431595 RepID=K3WRV2_GLOUD
MTKIIYVRQIGPVPASIRQQVRRNRVDLTVAVLLALYNWALWGFVSLLVLSQISGVVWDTTTSRFDVRYGQSPLFGTYAISGTNDEPYSDRMLLEVHVTAFYTNTCEVLAATLDAVFDACAALGYNVARDATLRIVDGVANDDVSLISTALPVLVMPYWDSALFAHYVIPGWDSSACAFQLSGKYDSQTHAVAFFYSVDRELRECKPIEWLQRPEGAWKHSWYEDTKAWRGIPASQRWIRRRQFDTLANRELDCAHNASACPDLSVAVISSKTLSIVISNGVRYGFFLYQYVSTRIAQSVYNLETFISNTTVVMLLFRWMRWKCPRWEHAGIGCLSSSRGFLFLPIILLPRLKYLLTAFFAVDCAFEGEQLALAESPFVVYPCIVEVVFYVKRVTDTFFGPTLLLFCLLHHQRMVLAQTTWFEFDGRINTAVASADVNALTLLDFVITDIALRINGNVKSMFAIKLAALALNALPLFCGATSTSRKSVGVMSAPVRDIEKTLETCTCCSGGLGRSSFMYEKPTTRLASGDGGSSSYPRALVLSSYELTRLGTKHERPSSFRVVLVHVRPNVDDGYEIVAPPAYYRLNDSRLRHIHF